MRETKIDPNYPTEKYTRKFVNEYKNVPLEDALQQARLIELECRGSFNSDKHARWETYLWKALTYGLWRWALATHIGPLRIPRRRTHELSCHRGNGVEFDAENHSPTVSAEREMLRTRVRARVRAHLDRTGLDPAAITAIADKTKVSPDDELRAHVEALQSYLRRDPVLKTLNQEMKCIQSTSI